MLVMSSSTKSSIAGLSDAAEIPETAQASLQVECAVCICAKLRSSGPSCSATLVSVTPQCVTDAAQAVTQAAA